MSDRSGVLANGVRIGYCKIFQFYVTPDYLINFTFEFTTKKIQYLTEKMRPLKINKQNRGHKSNLA